MWFWLPSLCFTLIALQRGHAVYRPLSQNSRKQKRCIAISIALTWIFSILLSVSFFLDEFMPYTWAVASRNSIAVKLLGLAVFLANAVIYYVTYCKAKSLLQRNPSLRSSGRERGNTSQGRTTKKREAKLTRAFLMMFIAYSQGFLMGIVSVMLQIVYHPLSRIISEASFIIFGCSAVLNPVLALLMHRDVRVKRSSIHGYMVS